MIHAPVETVEVEVGVNLVLEWLTGGPLGVAVPLVPDILGALHHARVQPGITVASAQDERVELGDFRFGKEREAEPGRSIFGAEDGSQVVLAPVGIAAGASHRADGTVQLGLRPVREVEELVGAGFFPLVSALIGVGIESRGAVEEIVDFHYNRDSGQGA